MNGALRPAELLYACIELCQLSALLLTRQFAVRKPLLLSRVSARGWVGIRAHTPLTPVVNTEFEEIQENMEIKPFLLPVHSSDGWQLLPTPAPH